jgi:hypothetical protein
MHGVLRGRRLDAWPAAAASRRRVNTGTAAEMIVPTWGSTAFNAGNSQGAMVRSCAPRT